MSRSLAYLSLQATRQGQASHAHVWEIVRGLEHRGWDVSVTEPRYGEGTAGTVRRIIGIGWAQLRMIVRMLRRPDVVYVRQHPLAFPTAVAARLLRLPVVQEINGIIDDMYELWPAARRFDRALRWFQAKQWAWARGIVAVTAGLGDYAAELSGATAPVAVISNGANTTVFHPDARQAGPLPDSYAVFFGSFSKWQGLHTILEAATGPEWPVGVDLVLVGSGPEQPAVEQAAADFEHVHYLGRLPYAEVAGVVAAGLCSLVVKEDVSQYAQVGFAPLKLYESAACGVPVVVTDLPGLVEFVAQSECGIVVPQSDAAAVAAAVRKLAEDPGEVEAMGARARAAAVAEHSWDRKAADTDAFIRDLVPPGDARERPVAIIMTTVPMSLQWLLAGQPKRLSDDFDVRLVTSPGPEVGEVEQSEGVPVHTVAMSRQITPLRDLASLWRLYRFMRQERPDLVHAYTPKAGLLGMLAAFLARVPHRVYGVIGMPLMEATGPKRALLLWLERLTYAMATNVHANSQSLRDYIAESVSSRPVELVGHGSANGVELEAFSPEAATMSRDEARRHLGIVGDPFVFLFVGRLVRDKGVAELVAASQQLAASRDVRVVLVGRQEGEWDAISHETAQVIDEHPALLAVGPQRDLLPFFQAADALVLPTYREGLPTILLEAASFGLPIVATDVVGCTDVVDDDVSGLLVPPRDPDALARAMERLIDDQALAKRLAAAAQRDVSDRFERDRFHDAMADAYRRWLGLAD